MASGPRIAIIGNAGGGKSTLAVKLAEDLGLPRWEMDCLLWQPDWTPAPQSAYASGHARWIEADTWIIDGLGRLDSVLPRLKRATTIVLVDMPLWMHFWLAAERQIAWRSGDIAHPPAGAASPPLTRDLFRTIADVDRDWMPEIRVMVDQEERHGKQVVRIDDVDQLRRAASLLTE